MQHRRFRNVKVPGTEFRPSSEKVPVTPFRSSRSRRRIWIKESPAKPKRGQKITAEWRDWHLFDAVTEIRRV